MIHVHAPLANSDLQLAVVPLRVDRLRLSKRLWRGIAEDGVEFGFELETPLKNGDTVLVAEAKRYVIEQEAEPVLEISLHNVTPAAAAGIGWAIGNLHLELSADEKRMLTLDDVATRQLLDRLAVPFVATQAVFRPGRFVRGHSGTNAAQDLGPSHCH